MFSNFFKREFLISKYIRLIALKEGFPDFNALVVAPRPLREGPGEVIQSECVQDLCHSFFQLQMTDPEVLFQLGETTKNHRK